MNIWKDPPRYDVYLTPHEKSRPRLSPRGITWVSVMDIQIGCASYLASLGKHRPEVTSLIVESTIQPDVNFLQHWPHLKSLTVRCYKLADLSGLAHCRNLTSLKLCGSLSQKPSVASMALLTKLQGLSVEGPNPGKGFEQLPAFKKLKQLHLYRPKWDLALIGGFAPEVEELSIYHHNATSLDFLKPLRRLRSVSLAYFRNLKSDTLLDKLKLAEIELTHCQHLKDRHFRRKSTPVKAKRR